MVREYELAKFDRMIGKLKLFGGVCFKLKLNNESSFITTIFEGTYCAYSKR
jgi:hypothetical protein